MAKTIFGTTEKSNFILNLTPAGLHRFCLRVLQLTLILLGAGVLLYELTLNVNVDIAEAMGEGGTKGMFASLLAGLRAYESYFAVGGVAALIFAMIAAVKRAYDKKSSLLPLCICGIMLVLAVASFSVCYDYHTGLFGIEGRSEGLLAIGFYVCFFLVGSLVRERGRLLTLFDWLVGFGLAGCAIALLQIIPLFHFPSSYVNLDIRMLEDVFLPSGLSGSPIMFAMLLTMLGGISGVTALFAAEEKRRRYHTIATVVFLFFLLRTQCVAGVVGTAVLAAGLLLAALLRKGGFAAGKKLGLFFGVIICAALLTYVSPAINKTTYRLNDTQVVNGYNLYDGAIVWQDGYYRLGAASPYSIAAAKDEFDPDAPDSLYPYLWGKATDAIRQYPLLGAGPDNYLYPQLSTNVKVSYNANLLDRPYNDYLYVAATRGIPALVCYLALVVLAFIRGGRSLIREKQWLYLAILIALAGYVASAVFGVSVIMVAPCFWMLLGAACGPYSDDITEKAPAKATKPAGKGAKH